MANVDDIEELNATRKINGVDDGLYTETIEVLQKELERKNKELDNYLETHKDYLSDEAEAIRKDIHRLINKIALLEKSATKKEENVANMTEEAFNEIIDNFEVVTYLTEYGRRGIKENVKRLQKENEEKDKYIKHSEEITTERNEDINKLLIEIKEKDKQIDELVKYIDSNNYVDNEECQFQWDFKIEKCAGNGDCKDCIKQYFENKAKE